MMKLTASPFSKRKTRNLIISSLNQNKTQNLNEFLEKKKYSRTETSSILQNAYKTNIKGNFRKVTFQSESYSKRLTLSEKLKMTSKIIIRHRGKNFQYQLINKQRQKTTKP